MRPDSGATDEVVGSYIRGLQSRYSARDVDAALDALRGKSVLVVGDLIIDEYCYCRVSGTVSKAPVIAAVYEHVQRMAGGGAAIARHVNEYAGRVEYLATVGSRDRHGEEVSELLRADGIVTSFFEWRDSFTVSKRRYITGGYPNPLTRARNVARGSIRLFEIGYMPATTLPLATQQAICERLADVAGSYDVVILADFGHGMVTADIAAAVARHAKWWSVNAQTNSTNYGFNLITKHRSADFVCIDELEARLPSGRRAQPIDQVVTDLKDAVSCDGIMVTRGAEGLMLFGRNGLCTAPALATDVVDTVGAGDAVLSVASLCRVADIDDELTVFLSACAGAVASSIIGNDEPVRRQRLAEYAAAALTPARETGA